MEESSAPKGEENNVLSPASLFPHREVSLNILKSGVGFAVRTPRGQKDPGHMSWDPKTNNQDKSAQTIHQLELIDDNIGVHLFGSLVDVDIDSDNPVLIEALDMFLPHTPHVWGRESRKKTHRLYELTGLPNNQFDPTEYRFLSVLSQTDSIKLEVRGGKMQSGRYSMMPGSLHPSGEFYEWENLRAARTSLVYAPVDKVMGAIRKACAVTVLAPYFTEGMRNKLCMAVSGFLYRVVNHIEETPNPTFWMDKEDARDFVNKLLDVVRDDESDRRARMNTFDQTWDKAVNGEKVMGLTGFAKEVGDDKLIPLLYSLLVDSSELQELDDFIERYWIRMNTSDIVDMWKIGKRNVVSIMSQTAFRASNMHRKVTIGAERRSLVEMLIHSKRANRFDGFAFAPDQEKTFERENNVYVNQWQGFEIGSWADPVTAKDVEPFLKYVKSILANDDPSAFEWILAWVADIFKHPEDKCGTALVLVGLPGSGKSFLGANIIRPIIGFDHSMQVNHISQLTQQFNADSSAKLFIQCDEAINSRRHEDANKLKSLITDPTKRVEPKGIDAYEVENHARIQFTSNNVADAVAITDGRADRRYAVFETNNMYAADSPLDRKEKDEYWRSMYSWTKDRDNMAKLHRYFMDHQYDRDLIRRPLDTKARRRIQQHSLRGFDDWLISVAASDHPLHCFSPNDARSRMGFYTDKQGKYVSSPDKWPEMISYSAIKDAYEIYRTRKGMRATTTDFNESQIIQELQNRSLLPMNYKQSKAFVTVGMDGMGDEIRRRINCRQFPVKKLIVEYVQRFGFEAEAEPLEPEDVEDTPTNNGPEY
jgi:hypothetical protein